MISVVFSSREEYEAFRAAFPSTLTTPDTVLGEPAELEDGRCVIAHYFTADEAALLQMAGADVRVGDADGPEFGSEP